MTRGDLSNRKMGSYHEEWPMFELLKRWTDGEQMLCASNMQEVL